MMAAPTMPKSHAPTAEANMDDDEVNTIRDQAANLSDGEAVEVLGEGDYSTHMDEIFSENGDDNKREQFGHESGEDDEETFVYTGRDAEEPLEGYQARLRDVLGADLDDSEEERLVEKSLIQEAESSSYSSDHARYVALASDHTASTSSPPPSTTFSPARMTSPDPTSTPPRVPRPFLHPTISRLRSYNPDTTRPRVVSTSSQGTFQSYVWDVASPSPSHLSAISRASSIYNLNTTSSTRSSHDSEREAFRWTVLRHIDEYLYSQKPEKANAVLGSSSLGFPTVLAANGLICVGTDAGRVVVFDFKQRLKCVCGDESAARSFGPVTALALSHDHTFVAVGHAYGHIQLYDINRPQVPARTVNPTSRAAVSSGRQEGHLFGSRIVQLGFISGRHTAIVSADDQGLAFYHSLGKVLFVEANDVLRILGKYPDEDPLLIPVPSKHPSSDRGRPQIGSQNGSTPIRSSLPPRTRQRRKVNTILSMAPLPLGTSLHPTDSYQLVALLTPIKLVVVGLKPSPKTWFRSHREGEEEVHSRSKWKGSLAWFPSVAPSNHGVNEDGAAGQDPRKEHVNGKDVSTPTTPLLAYSWGSTLNVLRVSEARVVQKVRNQKSGKVDHVESGKVKFETHGSLSFESDILAVQWLNANIAVFTATGLDVYDARTLMVVEKVSFDTHSLISPSLAFTSSGAVAYQDSVGDIAQSVRVYKGKIFVLGYKDLRVGTLLTWADRILSFVQEGDFLSAIDLTRAYYVGEAKGNKNGLPEDSTALRRITGEKMNELMMASARYTFSEERLTDNTHVTPDNRGVDRTTLFEGLVSTCVRACIALNDFDFIFEDLFQWYENSGILRIFLRQLESFVLDNSVHFVPPRITQRLISMHQEDGNLDDAERVIWHIDPECLDINQAISLCQEHHLYDALIYVYTRALRDYVSPVVELLTLVRKVQQRRKEEQSHIDAFDTGSTPHTQSIEYIAPSALKIYPYLANALSGLTYPSETPLPEEEALQAQTDIYKFLLYGRSSVWPAGDGGKLILTADEEGGAEPTYPYTRLLLKFDAEAFLHTLDIAFEHGYFNDETQGVNRQIIIKILFEIVASTGSDLSSSDVTFVNIFLARNIPKYPHFIHVTPSSLQTILIGLATDTDQSTREDRQLATEYLLSVYTPHDSDQILDLFEDAGFFRILRSWYRQERQWTPLIQTYLRDPDLHNHDVFLHIDDTLNAALRTNKNKLPDEVLATVIDALPILLQSDVPHAALLVDRYAPSRHSAVIRSIEANADHKRFAYLRCLLGPPRSGDDDGQIVTRPEGPSPFIDESLQRLYIALLCRLDESNAITALKYLSLDFLDPLEIAHICEEEQVYDPVVWILNERRSPLEALAKIDSFSQKLTLEIASRLFHSEENIEVQIALSRLQSMGRMGIAICLQHSQRISAVDVPLEDLWFKLLSCQIDCVQTISAAIPSKMPRSFNEEASAEEYAIQCLRALVHETFTGLVSVSSTKAVSFPRLFKRLVDSTAQSRVSSGTPYTEFRAIITGMLESYRSEGDLLVITKRLVERDLFDAMEALSKERIKGWMPIATTCASCDELIAVDKSSSAGQTRIITSRTGLIYHTGCSTV